ncbi:class I SAM-dependent methyltransferase [Dactylosporangium sp. NPDC000555]|uniref:class I SAM-dependent methyltransferase n=1 Tax=Dactylosporangium sp. NPDC000555 TaxID=3154260 RepID=UPI00332D8FB0
MPAHHHGHPHGQHHQGHHHHGEGLAALLDLDAEVLRKYHAGIVGWVREHAAGREPATIVDLGAGTGAGTLELLAQFPRASVVAVDSDAAMLERLTSNAARRGLAGRVRTVIADLDAGWPDGIGEADLVWAANSMHHLADPGRVLREIQAVLPAGGLLAVIELGSFPRFLPADAGVGRPGLEERCHEAMARRRAEDMPHMGADWAATLTGAGFEVRAERRFAADLPAPAPEAAGRYAVASLRRSREGLADDLDAEDIAALDALLDEQGPHSILRRTDLTVRAERLGWIAARPA